MKNYAEKEKMTEKYIKENAIIIMEALRAKTDEQKKM